LVAVAAAAAVLAIGLLSLTTGQTALEDAASSQQSTPTGESALEWTRVPIDGAVFGGAEVISVTVGGPGFVAVGSDGSDEDGDAAVWTSPDGISWSRVPHDEAGLGGEGAQRMTSVTAGGPGLVAVGSTEYYLDEYVSLSAAVWTSSDGITWSRVPHSRPVFGGIPKGVGGTEMSSVTAGGSGMVAVGWWEYDSLEAAFVWTSPDGIAWSQVPHDVGAFDSVSVRGITAGGAGFVAVGATESDLVPGVWTSEDGIKWTRVRHDKDAFGTGANELLSVASGASELVAVGRFSEPMEPDSPGSDNLVDHPAVWTSTDGNQWIRNVLPGEGHMTSVTATASGYVAVGRGVGAPAIWFANK